MHIPGIFMMELRAEVTLMALENIFPFLDGRFPMWKISTWGEMK